MGTCSVAPPRKNVVSSALVFDLAFNEKISIVRDYVMSVFLLALRPLLRFEMGDGCMVESYKSWAAVCFPIEGYRHPVFRNFCAKKRAKDGGQYFGEKLGAGARLSSDSQDIRNTKNMSHFYTTYRLDLPEHIYARTSV